MATTDARTGFRLPWSSDQRQQPSDADAVSVEDTIAAATGDPEQAQADLGHRHQAAGESAVIDADADAATPDPQAVTGATHAPGDATPDPAASDAPAPDAASATVDAVEPKSAAPAPAPRQSGPGRKPSKFLAELTKAMHAAAQSARDESLTRVQADAKSWVEQVHGRSSEEATVIRKTADDDIASIREWSKAEIARIREETEQRITDRKGRLEQEIDNHAAQIEREIERIQGRVASFESEMEKFFERLLAEEDPTRFAAMAENLPEPPSFDADADAGTTAEVDGVADAVADAWTVEPEAATVAVDAGEPETVRDFVAGTDVASDNGHVDAWAGTTWSGPSDEAAMQPVDASDAPVDAPLSPQEQEAAFAAIQAAAEEAAARELLEGATADSVDADAKSDITEAGAEPVAEAFGTTESVSEAAPEIDAAIDDLRLSALGLGADSAAAAEAEAFAGIDEHAADTEEIPMIADEALAARLAGLVPDNAGAPAEMAHTQVVVVGLVSVASIASFKRHLGRLTGVQSVGVSSGPDGEFIFSVTHAPEVGLADAIPTLPGFGARVTGTADSTINVNAHDPESDG